MVECHHNRSFGNVPGLWTQWRFTWMCMLNHPVMLACTMESWPEKRFEMARSSIRNHITIAAWDDFDRLIRRGGNLWSTIIPRVFEASEQRLPNYTCHYPGCTPWSRVTQHLHASDGTQASLPQPMRQGKVVCSSWRIKRYMALQKAANTSMALQDSYPWFVQS
jgi:hypothetical protein